MRRHGWALCLGALLTGVAAAQPPANEERFPPAPDLPGQVVSQPPTVPVGDAKDARPVPPAAAPLPDAALAPYSSTATTTVAPVGAAAAPCPAPAARKGCDIGWGDIKEWLLFRSNARQSGHFVTPYRPPLIAWFPCEPKRLPCGVGPVIGGPIGPPPAGVPVPEGPLPAPAPASTEPPLGGGVAVGKCRDAEVLTTFQPVVPGIGFTPGGAPMANPTTQIKPTSFKPK
jgi:hypothetical protein